MAKERKAMKKIVISSIMMAIVFAVSFSSVSLSVARAATLSVSPSSGSHRVGDVFSVAVYVSSVDKSANAYSGTVKFSPSLLEVTSVSKSGSIISSWATPLSYSNTAGTVSFSGITVSPGFIGKSGKILSVSFRVKMEGKVSVSLSDGKVLANDGKGTNILTAAGNAQYSLLSESSMNASGESPASPSDLPATPQVFSETHPDETQWYNNNSPAFSWILPDDVFAVNVIGDQHPTTDPGTNSDGFFTRQAYPHVADGQWYFHIRYKNGYGWGPVTHRAFGVDTVPPETPTIFWVNNAEGDSPLLGMSSTDATSGVSSYVLTVDDGIPQRISATGGSSQQSIPFPAEHSGTYSVAIQAFDAAGNASSVATRSVVFVSAQSAYLIRSGLVGTVLERVLTLMNSLNPSTNRFIGFVLLNLLAGLAILLGYLFQSRQSRVVIQCGDVRLVRVLSRLLDSARKQRHLTKEEEMVRKSLHKEK